MARKNTTSGLSNRAQVLGNLPAAQKRSSDIAGILVGGRKDALLRFAITNVQVQVEFTHNKVRPLYSGYP
jgi:hypothetical protein